MKSLTICLIVFLVIFPLLKTNTQPIANFDDETTQIHGNFFSGGSIYVVMKKPVGYFCKQFTRLFELFKADFDLSKGIPYDTNKPNSIPAVVPIGDSPAIEAFSPYTAKVWVSMKKGTKYHSKPNCSRMDNPMMLTIEEAISQGYDPCKKCYH